jgi:hypothetical protein
MELKYIIRNNVKIALFNSKDLYVSKLQDVIDIIAEAYYNESDCIIIYEQNISPDFFDLKTGFAGDILQKFSNYRLRLSIIGDFTKYKSKSFQNFILESNKYKLINFVKNLEEALAKLT